MALSQTTSTSSTGMMSLTTCGSRISLMALTSTPQSLSNRVATAVEKLLQPKNEKSLVKQVMEKKKTKSEEYKEACVNLNQDVINIPGASEDIKDAKAWLKHFASVHESQSATLVSGAIGELDKERLEKCIPVLKVGSKTCNGGDAKLEYIVKVMMSGLLEELDAHEQNIHRLKSALVLELVKHCVNVSLQSGKIDVKNIREQMQSRLVKLTTSSPPEASDVAMESLTDLFGRTRMSA